jgi:tetratricopeptide (TPR) repeat protein
LQAENLGDIRLSILSNALMVQIMGDLAKNDEAHQRGEQVIREADNLQHVNLQVIARYSQAYALVQDNQTSQALELYLQAEQLIRPTENLWMAMNYRPWLAQVLFDAGRMEEATAMVEDALRLARNAGSRFNEALAQRTEAQLFAASGSWDAALNSIRTSVSILQESESRLEMGRSIYVRGKIQHRRGEYSAASADWSQALEGFSSLGALRSVQQVREQIQAAS